MRRAIPMMPPGEASMASARIPKTRFGLSASPKASPITSGANTYAPAATTGATRLPDPTAKTTTNSRIELKALYSMATKPPKAIASR
jgi:hypothetical protein